MKGASAAGGIRKERSSNLELLRLLAMFCIVANHLVGQGDVLRDASGVNFLFSFFVGNAARISVNVFLIIGCWFMADASFRGSRFVKLWLEELFYTVILTLLMVCFYPADVKPNYVIAAFFPVFGYNHWFISGYLVLILLSPFLKKILEMRPERLKKLVLLLFAFTCIWSSVRPFENETMDTLVWFCSMFVFAGWYKRQIYKGGDQGREKSGRGSRGGWLFLFAAAAGYFLLCLLTVRPMLGSCGTVMYEASVWAGQFLQDYKALPNLLIAFCVFRFFLGLEIGSRRWINFFSTSTLAVYIVHQVPVFTLFLWKQLVRIPDHLDSPAWPAYMVGAILYMFLAITLLDKVREELLEKPLMKSGPVQKACRMLEAFYGDLI